MNSARISLSERRLSYVWELINNSYTWKQTISAFSCTNTLSMDWVSLISDLNPFTFQVTILIDHKHITTLPSLSLFLLLSVALASFGYELCFDYRNKSNPIRFLYNSLFKIPTWSPSMCHKSCHLNNQKPMPVGVELIDLVMIGVSDLSVDSLLSRCWSSYSYRERSWAWNLQNETVCS